MKSIKILVLLASLLISIPSFANSEEEKPAGNEPVYFAIKPNITVNVTGKAHILVIELQLYLKDTQTEDAIKKHLPMLRHDLITQFSGVNSATIDQIQTRAKLKELVLAYAKKIELPEEQVLDVLVTNMVMR